MSSENLDLSTEWTDAELSEQSSQWRAITDISSAISRLAEEAQWKEILLIAESRQVLIEQFFQKKICVPLFQQILVDLDQIKTQHQQVMTSVEKGLAHNEAKEASLKETRASIDGVYPRSP